MNRDTGEAVGYGIKSVLHYALVEQVTHRRRVDADVMTLALLVEYQVTVLQEHARRVAAYVLSG